MSVVRPGKTNIVQRTGEALKSHVRGLTWKNERVEKLKAKLKNNQRNWKVLAKPKINEKKNVNRSKHLF